APYVLPKPDEVLPRRMELHQTQVGWRLVNPKMPAEWTRSLGACAESVAESFGIGRAEQDEWALRSHQLSSEAWDKGFHDYVMPVASVTRDESIRSDSSIEKLATLKPAFSADGTVTAGNSSPINDGAIAVLMGPRAAASELDAEPFGQMLGSVTVGVEPERFSIAPAPAVRKLLARAGLGFSDIAVWEFNEAFAAMVLSCLSELPEVDRQRVNPNGGAIAIGHPLGASMPRVVVDLCRQLRRRGGGYGVAAACIGVGQGTAILVRVD
ncbi:MAG: thiolase family protein, partial [Micromonosporaceae bacterium]